VFLKWHDEMVGEARKRDDFSPKGGRFEMGNPINRWNCILMIGTGWISHH
jgi:hypothetical protein